MDEWLEAAYEERTDYSGPEDDYWYSDSDVHWHVCRDCGADVRCTDDDSDDTFDGYCDECVL